MSRRKKDPLRPLTDAERQALTRLSRSQAAPAVQVARATMLLAVAAGDDYQQAARSAGRRSGDAVSHLVARFNAEGLAALTPRHGGGQPRVYDHAVTRAGPPRGPARADARRPTARPPGRCRTLQKVAPIGPRRPAQGRDLDDLAGAPRGRPELPAEPHLVPDRDRAPQAEVSGTVIVTDPDAESKKS